MTIRTQAQLLAAIPGDYAEATVQGPNGLFLPAETLIKDIVDTLFAGVLDAKASVRFATSTTLAAYTVQGDGTILADANGAMGAQDGITPALGDEFLLQNGAAGVDDGVYVVTALGGASAKFLLTRRYDMGVGLAVAGAFFGVEEGTTYGDHLMVCTNDSGSDIVGTDDLDFSTMALLTLTSNSPQDVGAAAAVGTGTLAARDDHVHDHGAQADGAVLSHDTDQVEDMSGYGAADLTAALDAIRSRLGSRVVSGGQSSDGASQTITVYQIDVSAMIAMVGAVPDHIAALDDQDLLADIDGFQLDGSAPAALTADGQTYWVVLCLVLVSGVPAVVAVFGDEAADGAETEPTGPECQTAIVAGALTGHDATAGGVVFGRIKVQRTAVDTMVLTHTNITSDESLAQERLVGTLT